MIPYTTHPEAFIAVSAKKVIVIVIVIVSMLALMSCSVTKTIPAETVKEVTRTDTLYINNVQYDSIYVSQDLFTDRSKDTILIRQHDVEYRYKMLRDTIERVKIEVVHDSIPYEVRIKERVEVEKPMSTFYIICIVWFFVSIILLVWWFYMKTR